MCVCVCVCVCVIVNLNVLFNFRWYDTSQGEQGKSQHGLTQEIILIGLRVGMHILGMRGEKNYISKYHVRPMLCV